MRTFVPAYWHGRSDPRHSVRTDVTRFAPTHSVRTRVTRFAQSSPAFFAAELRRRVEGMQIFAGGFEEVVIEDLLQDGYGDAGVGHPTCAWIFWATLLDGVAVPWLS